MKHTHTAAAFSTHTHFVHMRTKTLFHWACVTGECEFKALHRWITRAGQVSVELHLRHEEGGDKDTRRRRRPDEKALRVTSLTGGGFMVWWWIKGWNMLQVVFDCRLEASHFMTALVSLLQHVWLFFCVSTLESNRHEVVTCVASFTNVCMKKFKLLGDVTQNDHQIYWTRLFCCHHCAYVGTAQTQWCVCWKHWELSVCSSSAPSTSLPYFTHDSIRLQLNDERFLPQAIRLQVSQRSDGAHLSTNDICRHSHMTSPCVN